MRGSSRLFVQLPKLRYAGYGTGLAAFALYYDHLQTEPPNALGKTSTISLVRSYVVWSLISVPAIVDAGPSLLSTLLGSPVPGVSTITEAMVKLTVFPQFIAGETAEACLSEMERLRRENIGCAFNYSAEADVDNAEEVDPQTLVYQEIERAVKVLGEFEGKMEEEGWARGSSCFAVKVSGLIDAGVLARASTTLHRMRSSSRVPYPGFPLDGDEPMLVPKTFDRALFVSSGAVPGMTVGESDPGLAPGDLEALALLWNRLDSIVLLARQNGVRVNIDGEETYFQPVLDGYTRLLAKKYNRPTEGISWRGPVVYATHQAYLRRQPEFLRAFLTDAAEGGYALGVKLVRGGYIVKEGLHWDNNEFAIPNPIWATKPETDEAYNASVDTLCEAMAAQLQGPKPELAPSVIFGTHNADSVGVIFSSLRKYGLVDQSGGKMSLKENVAGKIGIAQLYGMKEDLSDRVVAAFHLGKTPISLKFIAYGTVSETLPFLCRRAVENKSLLGTGSAVFERKRVGKELLRRFSLGLWA